MVIEYRYCMIWKKNTVIIKLSPRGKFNKQTFNQIWLSLAGPHRLRRTRGIMPRCYLWATSVTWMMRGWWPLRGDGSSPSISVSHVYQLAQYILIFTAIVSNILSGKSLIFKEILFGVRYHVFLNICHVFHHLKSAGTFSYTVCTIFEFVFSHLYRSG